MAISKEKKDIHTPSQEASSQGEIVVASAQRERELAIALAELGAIDLISAENMPTLNRLFGEEFAMIRLTAIARRVEQYGELMPLVKDKKSFGLMVGKINQYRDMATGIVKNLLKDIKPAEVKNRPFVPGEAEQIALEVAIDKGYFDMIDAKRMPFIADLPPRAIKRQKIESYLNALNGWRDIAGKLDEIIKNNDGFPGMSNGENSPLTHLQEQAKSEIKSLLEVGRNFLAPDKKNS